MFVRLNQKHWLHWKSEKDGAEPNELDELKCWKSLNQTTNFAHWHAFLYLHPHIKYLFILTNKNQKEKNELNELSELEYLKTPSQKSTHAHTHIFFDVQYTYPITRSTLTVDSSYQRNSTPY